MLRRRESRSRGSRGGGGGGRVINEKNLKFSIFFRIFANL
jgi:hypothetical protein